mmetsp:Transcript_53108/g.88275  ORF Transcript_53108/g.88275 Transcript_53108/m.88275 type:complete len:142 (+) Transcript_53108:101-526(+)
MGSLEGQMEGEILWSTFTISSSTLAALVHYLISSPIGHPISPSDSSLAALVYYRPPFSLRFSDWPPYFNICFLIGHLISSTFPFDHHISTIFSLLAAPFSPSVFPHWPPLFICSSLAAPVYLFLIGRLKQPLNTIQVFSII